MVDWSGLGRGMVDAVMPNPPSWEGAKQLAKGMLTPPDPYEAAGEMVTEARQGNYGKALEAGMGMPGLPSQGMFIGMKSPLFNKDRFRGAMELTANHASPDEIWHKTQTAQFPGAAWAQEISDHTARFDEAPLLRQRIPGDYFPELRALHPDATSNDIRDMARARAALAGPKQPAYVPDVVTNHPELMDAYPGLKQVPVGIERDPTARGSFDNTLMSINLRTGLSRPTPVALHETQHYVQEMEGWPKGGSPEMFDQPFWQSFMQPGESNLEAYLRLAGEQMANATMARWGMKPAQRAVRAPHHDMLHHADDQIIRR